MVCQKCSAFADLAATKLMRKITVKSCLCPYQRSSAELTATAVLGSASFPAAPCLMAGYVDSLSSLLSGPVSCTTRSAVPRPRTKGRLRASGPGTAAGEQLRSAPHAESPAAGDKCEHPAGLPAAGRRAGLGAGASD